VLPADLSESYGGPYSDEQPVENPTVQISAANDNRALEDCAQMTRTCWRAIVKFTTTVAAGPVAVTVTSHTSVWGMGDAHKPTISKTATGVYAITYAASYTDALGEEEDVSWTFSDSRVGGATAGFAMETTLASNVATITVFSTAGSASDLTGTATVTVYLR
jgi:hypothetical protein